MPVTIFDAFKVATESLSPDVYRNATWSSVWLNLIERGEYPVGVGTLRSTFTIANQQPATDEEAWTAISTSSGALVNSCSTSYSAVGAGYDEKTYSPESFSLQGPTLCKDDLSLEFNASTFIPTYVEEITKRAKKAWENRYSAIYEQLTPKYVISGPTSYDVTTTQGSIATTVGIRKNTNPEGLAPSVLSGMATGVTLAGVPTNGVIYDINQKVLDGIALELMYNGATNPDSNGFISLGSDGPIFSLYISPDASSRIIQEDTSSGFRSDLRYNDNGQSTPELMKRIGGTRVVKNWRHIPDLFPARYGYGVVLTTCNTSTTAVGATGVAGTLVTITTGTTANNFGFIAGGGQSYVADIVSGVYSAVYQGMPVTGAGIPSNTYVVSVDTVSTTGYNAITISAAATATAAVSLTFGAPGTSPAMGKFHRVPTWLVTHSSMSGGPSKGWKAVLNPAWKKAPYESARILSPRVVQSEIVRPIDAVGSLSWSPMNTLGDFQWVTGATKFTTSNVDPTEKYGAHFAEFKHAPRPMFVNHGGSIIYKRA